MDLLKSCLFVGLGGFLGAVLRFLICSLPIKSTFPLTTFIVNFLAAVLMGFFIGLFSGCSLTNSNMSRFFTTGVCGGFSTFSTFSSELTSLFKNGNHIIGVLYAIGSVVCCVGGILLGEVLANLIFRKA
jgi:CrcB protein